MTAITPRLGLGRYLEISRRFKYTSTTRAATERKAIGRLKGRWIFSGGLLSLPSTLSVRYRAVEKGTMNVRSNLLNSTRRRRIQSALAYVLLLTIGYGAIVEAAHSHGVSSLNSSQLAAISGDDASQSSYQGHSGHSECSLCQFQQQLFGSLTSVILVAHTAQQLAFHCQQTISYLSTSALPTRGRGPPSL